MSEVAERLYLTVGEAAELLAIADEKVLRWLASGELRGVNVAQRNGARHRWRIARSDLDSFLAMRSTSPPPPKVTRRRRAPAREHRVYYT